MRVKLGKQPIVLLGGGGRCNNDSHYHRGHRTGSRSKNVSFENLSTLADRVKFPLPPRLFSSSHPFTILSSAANSFFIRPSVRRGQSGWPTFRRQSGVTRRNRRREEGRRFDPHHRGRKLGRSDRVRRVRMVGSDGIRWGRGQLRRFKSMSFAICSNLNAKGHRATVAGDAFVM